MNKRGDLLFIIVVIAGILVAGGPVIAGQHSEPTPFSVQMHSLLADFARHKRSVDMISAVGIKQVRDEIFWHLVEKQKGVYKIPEAQLRNLDYSCKKGLDTLLILDYANPLYEGGNAPTKDESLQAFGKYCYTMAKELKGKLKYFEVWNEPNVDGFWRPRHNPQDYTRLLKIAYKEVKRGNPEAVVVGMALSGIDEDFFYKVLEYGGYDSMDVISFHPYCHPKGPDEAEILERTEKVYQSLKKYGKPKPIWFTEIGWPTHIDGGVSEETQAAFLARMYILSLTVPYIKTTFWYWFGPDGPQEDWAEDRFGVIDSDWRPKPSYHAYKTVIDVLGQAQFVKKLTALDGIRAYHFTKEGKNIYALWVLDGTKEIAVVALAPGPIDIVDVKGRRQTCAPIRKYGPGIYLTLTDSPLFVESQKEVNLSVTEKPLATLKFETGENVIPRGQSQVVEIVLDPWWTGLSVNLWAEKSNLIEITKGWNKRNAIKVKNEARPGSYTLNYQLEWWGEQHPFACLKFLIEVTEPLGLLISPLPPLTGEKKFMLQLTNDSLTSLTGTLTLTAEPTVQLDKKQFDIKAQKPGQQQNYLVTIKSQHPWDKVFNIKATAKLQDGLTIEKEEIISFYQCIKTQKGLKIDGDLSDWREGLKVPRFKSSNGLEPIRLGSNEQYTGGYVKWDGPQDSNLQVYTAWDKDWFYFGVEFEDDRLSSPCTGQQVYNNDGIEVYFDTDHYGDKEERRYSADDHQYGLFLTQGQEIVWAWSQLGGESKASRIKINKQPQPNATISGRKFEGMIIEAAIPLREINLAPSHGKQIGFCVAYTDDDDPASLHPFFQELQMTWTGRKNAWQNPTAFADLFFIDPKKTERKN